MSDQLARGGPVEALASMIAATRGGAGPFGSQPAARPYGPKGAGEYPAIATPAAGLGSATDPVTGRVLDEIANPTSGNVLTPTIVKGAGAKASDLNLYTLTSNVWVPVTIDRPEIWIPQGFAQAVIWYSPNLVPKVASSVGDLQKSTKHGVVYLSSPGTWWLQYTLSPAASITMLRIDAFQPGVVSRYLSEPGTHNCISTVAAATITAPTVTFPTDGSVVTVLAANRDRVACTLQNNSTTTGGGDGRILLTHSSDTTLVGKNPIASGNLGGPRGTVLTVGSSITFAGDTCVKGAIRACCFFNSAASNYTNPQLDILEYV